MSLLSEVVSFFDGLRNGPYDQPILTAADRLIVAVSGGPDSLSLLHLLSRQRIHPAENLVVAHLNHGMRQSAADDEVYVTEIASSWGLECRVGLADVVQLAQASGMSLEEAGRASRYRFLAELAAEIGSSVVATGHNADDQAETVLMHFVRGTGLAGLRGMLPVAPMHGDPSITLIRPLLTASRGSIEAYCREHHLSPVIDESNVDTTFFRNWMRHRLLPSLSEHNPRIRERLLNMASVVTADYAVLLDVMEDTWPTLLLDETSEYLQLDRDKWLALSLGLRRSTLRHAVWLLEPSLRDVGFQTVELARQVAEVDHSGAEATLPGGLKLTVSYDRLCIGKRDSSMGESDLPQLADPSPNTLSVPGALVLAGGWTIEVGALREHEFDEIIANQNPWLAFVDVGEAAELIVRPRKPGERFQPLGMGGKRSRVSDVMINRKIPAGLRQRWPIVALGDDLVWLVGHHLDERARVTPDSRRVLRLSARRTS